jgi:NAD-reducing hydrogenase large subunit
VAQIARHCAQSGNGAIPAPMLNRIENGIRCSAPCLSCSTHALGQLPLPGQLIVPGGAVVRELTRD